MKATPQARWHFILVPSCKLLHLRIEQQKKSMLACRSGSTLRSPCGLTNYFAHLWIWSRDTGVLAQLLLPKLPVLIRLSTEIVSFLFRSAEKLAARLQCSHHTSSPGLISISSNQNSTYWEHKLVYLHSVIGLWIVSVCSSKLAYTCSSLTSTNPWWNDSVCLDRGRERLGEGDSACCLFNLLDFRSDGDWTVTQAITEKWTESLPWSHK